MMVMNKFFPELLTVDEAADVLKVTPHQVKELLRHNRIAFVHIGTRTKRISREALMQFIEKSTITPPLKIDPVQRVILKSKVTLKRGRSLKTR